MYASVTTSQCQPGQYDEVLRLYAAEIAPELKHLPGFVISYFLTNRETEKTINIVIYASEADAMATQTSGKFQALIHKVAHLLMLETVHREGYTVSE